MWKKEPSKTKKNMTEAELRFYTRIPQILSEIADEMKKQNELVKKLMEKLDEVSTPTK